MMHFNISNKFILLNKQKYNYLNNSKYKSRDVYILCIGTYIYIYI